MPTRRLDLLLAEDATGRAVLGQGLPANALLDPPRPRRSLRGDDSPFADNLRADIDDLSEQRWDIVAPAGDEGKRLLEAIAPLRRLREAQQNAPVRVYLAPPDMSMSACVDWKDDVYYAEGVPEHERPRYLLLLGDLHQLSVELQHALANGSLVGRLAFTRADGTSDLPAYEAYASKVLTHAARTAAPAPELRLFTARDGSAATELGDEQLVRPCRDAAERLRASGHLVASAVRSLADAGDLMRAAAEGSPAVLLSVSHGVGVSTTPEKRRARQGALQLSPSDVLDAERVRSGPFLPGGIWFCVACFGIGTPAMSAYYPWLRRLADADPEMGDVDYVMRCLPGPGERPFIAAMPQAALANPEGPLAIIGHMDLAWCYSFSSGETFSESRASRILSPLKAIVNGGRAGVAVEALMRHYREVNDALTADYDRSAAFRADGKPDPTDGARLANQWMLRNDLRGYILLGDPAARLPIGAPEAPPAPAPAVSPPPAVLSVSTALADPGAAAVDALLGGNETPRAVAARYGLTLDALWERLRARWAGQG